MKYVVAFLITLTGAASAVPPIHVSTPENAAAVQAPVFALVTLPDNMLDAAGLGQLRLKVSDTQGRQVAEVPVQFQPDVEGANTGTFWWLLPPQRQGPETAYRYFAANTKANVLVAARYLENDQAVLVTEDDLPVLRYNHGETAVPEGIDPVYARGDYIHPLWGNEGEILTDDYPEDHPHHRGINWSWATIRWSGETRDAFAVRGVKAAPAARPRIANGPVFATIDADSEWLWDDGLAIMAETVSMRVYRETESGRLVDIDITLTPLVDGLEMGGRLHRGYSGFNLRMPPGTGQETRLRREQWVGGGYGWGDYSAVFGNRGERSGVTVLEHVLNPGYPNQWRQYPTLNYFQPAWPGGAPIAMPKGESVTLRHRLWIHDGRVTEELLKALRASYDECCARR